MMKVYGYCRCSTDETKQDVNRQVRELKEMGATPDTIFTEYISGMKENKVELQKLLNVIQPGDTLAVTEVSRLTRSTRQLCEMIDIVKDKHIKLVIKDSITIDCSNGEMDPMTKAFLQIAGVFGELERDIISARVKSGIKNAKAKGKKVGRPRMTTSKEIKRSEMVKEYYELYQDGRISKKHAAECLKVSRPTLDMYFKIIEAEQEQGA
jgi:DNA invertase Pin-like site-specific DNA recombinase